MFDPIVIGIVLGQTVPLFQIYKMLKTGKSVISLWTYVFLAGALICYFIHAAVIGDVGFMVAHGLALLTNGSILYLLIRRNGK